MSPGAQVITLEADHSPYLSAPGRAGRRAGSGDSGLIRFGED
jgi:hypothetical protein